MDWIKCCLYLAPGAHLSCGLTYESIVWNDPRPMPAEAECLAAWPLVQAQDAAAATAATTANTNRLTLEQQAVQALADNKVFYSRASSTTAQVLAQVKALSRQNNGLIRMLLKRLDGVD